MSAISGIEIPALTAFKAFADSIVGTATRTSSQPASAKWLISAIAFSVCTGSVVIID